jgi:beta-mannosidase
VGIRAFEDDALQFRQRSKMEWLQPGLDGWGMMRIYARRYAADPIAEDTLHTPLERWIYLTQFTQALGLREALERHRTSDGKYAGSLYWQLSDVWPTVSWSTVDYYGRWKLAHHAVQQANKPRCVQRAHGRATETFVAFNDAQEALESTALQLALLNIQGDTLHAENFTVDLAPFSHHFLELGEAYHTSKGILRWTWSDGAGTVLDEGMHLHYKPGEVDWPDATIETVWKGDSLVLTSDLVALGVRLQLEGVQFEENGFMLFPNEPKTVRFQTTGSQNAARNALSVEHFAQYQ